MILTIYLRWKCVQELTVFFVQKCEYAPKFVRTLMEVVKSFAFLRHRRSCNPT